MLKIAVVGARGYTGTELLPLLYRHPVFDLVAVGSGSAAGEVVSDHVPGLDGCQLGFTDLRAEDLGSLEIDACVLALPNGAAAPYVNAIDRHRPDTVIVDLGADYRFDATWAYGQPERFADRIAGAKRIANPGCYATGAQLALAPLVGRIVGAPVVFGVSGFSGAGKAPSRKNDPEVLQDNLLPYQLADHIHEREVSFHIGRTIRLLPHVAPFFRGINLSVAVTLASGTSPDEMLQWFGEIYDDCPLVEVRAEMPEVREVCNSHRAIIGGFTVSVNDPRRLSLVAVLDNLLKGAATQAVQNLNLAFGLDDLSGIAHSGEKSK
ncbi:MAG: N-acetyl-gamma-glutamyl-phosphate reductase [Gammaproteobacteria bacterium]|nr:N-acetyl-gamma-glutamyl-phosphate reductase [Gammaproteobacteria bacterium]MBT8055711.1 N-acetyl-gamma-glutamyl-phosphate reductase [Gammaproteobacteria bacterium]NNJ78282.1 N-acetyl-gamma-glutamyl-phosphate reductase [Xanthomonadales bacterium]